MARARSGAPPQTRQDSAHNLGNSAAASMLVAQDAKIRIRVTPPDALISIDGKSCGKGPIREIQTIPGPHVVIVSKYDFTSERREVLLRKEDNPGLEFTLRRRDNTFSAQSGGIQIETESSAAVLVNGDANDYFIDHPPMLNNNPTCFVRQFDEWSPALCQLAPR